MYNARVYISLLITNTVIFNTQLNNIYAYKLLPGNIINKSIQRVYYYYTNIISIDFF